MAVFLVGAVKILDKHPVTETCVPTWQPPAILLSKAKKENPPNQLQLLYLAFSHGM